MHKFSDILLTRTLGHVLYLQANNGIQVLFSRADAEDFEYRTLEGAGIQSGGDSYHV